MNALQPHIQSLIYSYDDTCLATLRRDVLPSIRAIEFRRSHFFIDTIDREMKREDRADRESGRFFYYG